MIQAANPVAGYGYRSNSSKALFLAFDHSTVISVPGGRHNVPIVQKWQEAFTAVDCPIISTAWLIDILDSLRAKGSLRAIFPVVVDTAGHFHYNTPYHKEEGIVSGRINGLNYLPPVRAEPNEPY